MLDEKAADRKRKSHVCSSSASLLSSPLQVFCMMGGPSNGAADPSMEEIVLDPKPLRTLAPMFPAPLGSNIFTPPGARQFVCVTPFGSFFHGSEAAYPPGFCPLYPTFPAPQASNQRSADAAPMGAAHVGEGSNANGSRHTKSSMHETQANSLIVLPNEGDGDSLLSTPISASGRKIKQPSHLYGYEIGSSEKEGSGKRKGTKRKRPKITREELLMLPASPYDARESVEVVLMTFDAIRRRLWQLDEVQDMGLNRRPDQKAGTVMMDNELRANTIKRIGHVPGIEVGDLFYFRTEICLVGLHAHTIAGIDYMTVKFEEEEDPVALCIVSSGGYENQEGDVDSLVYTGAGGGGGNKSDKRQVDDQKLERGNLALSRSLHRANEIRVIRSEKDFSYQNGKIYVYDGLYKIRESWVEKGKSGFNLFKYKLLREPGQPDGIAVWKMTQKWKENPSSRGKVILPDMSSGMENVPVCLVNEVDDEKGPSHFTYATKVNYLNPISSTKPLQSCMCSNVCLPGDANCSCTQKNAGYLPYSSNALLVSRKPMIYECSALCQCSVNCRNRVTQKGIRLHFEVFRTRNRGWGLRSWDPIRAGTFICEYIGEVTDKIKVEDEEEDEYIFHATHDDRAFRWNYGPELMGEPRFVQSSEPSEPLPIVINAKRIGNIARFMNHSCSPNVFWQPVQHDHGDEGYPHIMFFAMKHIPPMTELTYDYGTSGAGIDKEGMDKGPTFHTLKKCLCGSPNCRGSFG